MLIHGRERLAPPTSRQISPLLNNCPICHRRVESAVQLDLVPEPHTSTSKFGLNKQVIQLLEMWGAGCRMLTFHLRTYT